MVFRPGERITVAAAERIEAAKAEWRAEKWGERRFDLPADDRDEHIPLPG